VCDFFLMVLLHLSSCFLVFLQRSLQHVNENLSLLQACLFHTQAACLTSLSSHPSYHHKNLVTCGTTQSVPTAPFDPSTSQSTFPSRGANSIGTPSITHPDSNYSVIASHLSKRSIPCSIPSAQMELVRNGCNNRIGITFTDGSQYELVHLDYCPGFICQYPGPPTDYDDRHKDWGCRGRVNNVACRGHPSWGTGLRFDQLSQHTVSLPAPPICPPQGSSSPIPSDHQSQHSPRPIPPLRRDISLSSSSSCPSERSFTNSWDRHYRETVNDGWD
jgi:hypothetical protein